MAIVGTMVDSFIWMAHWCWFGRRSLLYFFFKAGFILNECFRDAHFFIEHESKCWGGSIHCSHLSKESPPSSLKRGLGRWEKQQAGVWGYLPRAKPGPLADIWPWEKHSFYLGLSCALRELKTHSRFLPSFGSWAADQLMKAVPMALAQ